MLICNISTIVFRWVFIPYYPYSSYSIGGFMEIEFAPHIEEIKRALDNEIEDDRIREDLKKLLEYRVPLAEAKRSLIRKYGGVEKSTVRKLGEIEISDRDIEITAQVMEI